MIEMFIKSIVKIQRMENNQNLESKIVPYDVFKELLSASRDDNKSYAVKILLNKYVDKPYYKNLEKDAKILLGRLEKYSDEK